MQLWAHLSSLVPDKGDDHRVEVEEEHEQVETKLNEGLLLVHVQFPEDLGGVEQVLVLEDPKIDIVSMSALLLFLRGSETWISSFRER